MTGARVDRRCLEQQELSGALSRAARFVWCKSYCSIVYSKSYLLKELPAELSRAVRVVNVARVDAAL
jgi:hypothetical protein